MIQFENSTSGLIRILTDCFPNDSTSGYTVVITSDMTSEEILNDDLENLNSTSSNSMVTILEIPDVFTSFGSYTMKIYDNEDDSIAYSEKIQCNNLSSQIDTVDIITSTYGDDDATIIIEDIE